MWKRLLLTLVVGIFTVGTATGISGCSKKKKTIGESIGESIDKGVETGKEAKKKAKEALDE